MNHLKQSRLSVLSVTVLTFFFAVSIAPISAQKTKIDADKTAIKSMVGCFEVEFKYTETFSPEVDYEKAYDYTSAALEWAEIIEESDGFISIQHLLVLHDTVIIKHWRQDWTYEDSRSFKYHKDNTWRFFDLNTQEVKGKWTQEVYQVDDSPRYAGTATWSHVDGTSTWSHKADSPLPRREYTKRDDYNVMKRGNRIHILANGWLHEQDNDKVIRKDNMDDVLLVQEKGYNTYKKVEDERCKLANSWWNDNYEMWSRVRNEWNEVFHNTSELKLHIKVDDKRLYEHLFFSEKPWKDREIGELIDSYMATQVGL